MKSSQKNESRKQADSSEACRKAKVCLLLYKYIDAIERKDVLDMRKAFPDG